MGEHFFFATNFIYVFSGTKQKLADDFNGELRVWGDIDAWKIFDLPF